MKKKEYKYNYPENNELGKKILHGERKLISDMTGFSKSYISEILKGNRNNERVINIAKDLIALRNVATEKYK